MFIATKRALRGFISETSGNQLLTVSLLLISIPAYSSFKNSNTNNKTLLLLLISWCLASCGHYNVPREREKECVYKPNDRVTDNLFLSECFMYPFFDFSLFHLPCMSIRSPPISFSDAVVAPPARILCNPKL